VTVIDVLALIETPVSPLYRSSRSDARCDRCCGPYTDVAAEISEQQGRKVTYVNVDDDATRDVLLGYGLGEWLVNALIDLYQDYRRSGPDGYASEVTETVDRITGRQPRSLRSLLSEQPAGAS
jgi:hypothetical protein